MIKRRAIVGLSILALALGATACGGDDDDDTTASDETTPSAEQVTVTTGDTESLDGFSWEVEPTPTAETKTIEYVNESEQPHALFFARINEGFTFEEAYKLEGRQGSAKVVAQTDERNSPEPGDTVTVDITGPIEPGNYALFCPIPGHYQQGQLEEFDIQ